MYVNQYTVAVTTKGGTTVTFSDADKAGSAAAALASLEKGQTIDAVTVANDVETRNIIPFCAVDHATVTFSRTTADDPTDDTCQ